MLELKNEIIGCIGTGNMGEALIRGLSDQMPAGNIYCYDREEGKTETLCRDLGVRTVPSLEELCRPCDIVIIAVKPDLVLALAQEIKHWVKGKVVISIAAGVTLESLEHALGTEQMIIRVMPNTPALVEQGMSVLSPNKSVQEDALVKAELIFQALGKALILPEKLMDAVTAVSGCGPAYGFTMIQAMADGGVKMGIPRDKALLLAAQTLLGAATMVLELKEDPITLRGRVTSPGGSTIDAVHVMEKAGFSGIVMDAIETAAVKSERLGRKQ